MEPKNVSPFFFFFALSDLWITLNKHRWLADPFSTRAISKKATEKSCNMIRAQWILHILARNQCLIFWMSKKYRQKTTKKRPNNDQKTTKQRPNNDQINWPQTPQRGEACSCLSSAFCRVAKRLTSRERWRPTLGASVQAAKAWRNGGKSMNRRKDLFDECFVKNLDIKMRFYKLKWLMMVVILI